MGCAWKNGQRPDGLVSFSDQFEDVGQQLGGMAVGDVVGLRLKVWSQGGMDCRDAGTDGSEPVKVILTHCTPKWIQTSRYIQSMQEFIKPCTAEVGRLRSAWTPESCQLICGSGGGILASIHAYRPKRANCTQRKPAYFVR
jgi:hypothetical protein